MCCTLNCNFHRFYYNECITFTGFAESWEINSELEYAENATALYLSSYDVYNDSIYLSQPYSVYNLDGQINLADVIFIMQMA